MKINQAFPFGRYFEDFEKGSVFIHRPGKTITETDNNLFCLLTMNHHPVHLDTEYARNAGHGRILVVGTLVFSLAVGMSVRDVSGKAIANLGYHEIEHKGPVFIGDTINAETTVLQARPSSSKPDRGIIRVETRAYNQNHELVLIFQRSVLIPRRPKEVKNG